MKNLDKILDMMVKDARNNGLRTEKNGIKVRNYIIFDFQRIVQDIENDIDMDFIPKITDIYWDERTGYPTVVVSFRKILKDIKVNVQHA